MKLNIFSQCNQAYDYNDYLSTVETKPLNLCNEETTSTAPTVSDPDTGNTQTAESFMTEHLQHGATTQSTDFILTTEEINLDLTIATTEENSASSTSATVGSTTSGSEHPTTSERPQSDTSTASNGNVDISSSRPAQFDTSTASNGNVDISSSRPAQSDTSTASNGNVDISSSRPAQSDTSTASNGNEDISSSRPAQSDTSTASNGNEDISSSRPAQSDTSTASNGNEDISSSGPPRCREVRVPLTNTTLTLKELEEAVEKIIDHLSVNTEDLSSVKRSKISAPDNRVSSTTMGMGGIVFIVVVLGLVFVSDVSKLVHDLRSALGGTKKSKV